MLSRSLFHNSQNLYSAYFKGGDITTTEECPLLGMLVYADQPQQGITRVACDQAHSGRMGVVSHDRSANADLEGSGLQVIRNTYQKFGVKAPRHLCEI